MSLDKHIKGSTQLLQIPSKSYSRAHPKPQLPKHLVLGIEDIPNIHGVVPSIPEAMESFLFEDYGCIRSSIVAAREAYRRRGGSSEEGSGVFQKGNHIKLSQ